MTLQDQAIPTAGAELGVYNGSAGDDLEINGTESAPIYAAMYGGAGNDTLLGNDVGETLEGNDGDDRLQGGRGDDSLWGGDGNDYLDGGLGADALDGGSGADHLLGSSGNDSIYGGRDDDHLQGEEGNDLLLGGNGNDHLQGDGYGSNQGNDFLDGGDGDDHLLGGGGHDILIGGNGNDRIQPRPGLPWPEATPTHGGSAAIDAGAGNDSIILTRSKDGIATDLIDGGEGRDSLTILDVLTPSIHLQIDENGSANAFAEGGWQATSIETIYSDYSNSKRYLLYFNARSEMSSNPRDELSINLNPATRPVIASWEDGSLVVKTLSGNSGDGDTVLFSATGGSFQLHISGGWKADLLYGNDGDDHLQGNNGNDTLVAGSGNDFIDGGEGNDTFVARGHTVGISDSGGADTYDLNPDAWIHIRDVDDGGKDTWIVDTATWRDHSVPDAMERVVVRMNPENPDGIINITRSVEEIVVDDSALTGEQLANSQLTINATDTGMITAGDGNDTIFLTATTHNTSIGSISGGSGYDTFHTNAPVSPGVISSVESIYSYRSIHDGLLASGTPWRVSGDDGGNRIALHSDPGMTGGQLEGGGGSDWLTGSHGNDVLAGDGLNQSASDTLDGALGQDTLSGGNGADVFVINCALDGSNVKFITDFQTGVDKLAFAQWSLGTQSLRAGAFSNDTSGPDSNTRLHYDAASGELRFDADGTGPIEAVIIARFAAGTALELADIQLMSIGRVRGDAADNVSRASEFNDTVLLFAGHDLNDGGDGSDTIYGHDGNDTLSGNLGSDLLLGGTGQDSLAGNAGYDTLRGDNGNDFLDGGFGRDLLVGGAGQDTLFGGHDSDRLDGGAGRDQLSGGSGADTFIFGNSAAGSAQVDSVIDFVPGEDRIELDMLLFASLDAGTLNHGQFSAGWRAMDADDFIIYSPTGQLYYDADGSGEGAAIKIAILANKAELTAADIVVC